MRHNKGETTSVVLVDDVNKWIASILTSRGVNSNNSNIVIDSAPSNHTNGTSALPQTVSLPTLSIAMTTLSGANNHDGNNGDNGGAVAMHTRDDDDYDNNNNDNNNNESSSIDGLTLRIVADPSLRLRDGIASSSSPTATTSAPGPGQHQHL
jgi:hypothetical protein